MAETDTPLNLRGMFCLNSHLLLQSLVDLLAPEAPLFKGMLTELRHFWIWHIWAIILCLLPSLKRPKKCDQHLTMKDSNVWNFSIKYQHLEPLKQAVISSVHNRLTLLKRSKIFNSSVILVYKKKNSRKLLGQLHFITIKKHGGF